MVDEDAPHQPRAHAQEVGTSLPARALLAHQAQEDLVNERRRLERMAAALSPELGRGLAPEVAVDDRA
jgi:hypothetical protein